jgi:hypothetical protein
VLSIIKQIIWIRNHGLLTNGSLSVCQGLKCCTHVTLMASRGVKVCKLRIIPTLLHSVAPYVIKQQDGTCQGIKLWRILLHTSTAVSTNAVLIHICVWKVTWVKPGHLASLWSSRSGRMGEYTKGRMEQPWVITNGTRSDCTRVKIIFS